MQAVYYRAADGSEPVSEFLEALPPRCLAALDNQMERLNTLGEDDPPPPFPHSSQVDGELRELRCHCGRDLYRLLYRRSENLFILLHIIHKSFSRSIEPGISKSIEPPRAAVVVRQGQVIGQASERGVRSVCGRTRP